MPDVAPGADEPDHPFRKIGERTIYEGYVIRVGSAQFEGPGGVEMVRDVVHHPGAVSVVPVKDDRSAIEGMLLEIPAGKRDVDGEPPDVTARRELAEEVGYEAAELVPLIVLAHSPGFCDELNHIYLATGLTPCERAVDGPEEEHMTIVEVPLDDVFSLIGSGELYDAKSVVGVTLAHHRLFGAPGSA